MRLHEWLNVAEKRLTKAGIESARLDAQVLAAHLLGKDRSWVIAHPEANLPEKEAERLLLRREQREPLAYLVGVREFFGRAFRVSKAVLIPRQETETLIEAALGLFPVSAPTRVLDIGTGSGCIALTLKLERPAWEVWGADISEPALSIAKDNAKKLGAKVHFLQSDLFESFRNERFDLIVTNPPYIGETERLMPEVANHEPTSALFAGSTGLELFGRLAKVAPRHLASNGYLLTEVGHGQANSVQEVFEESGWRFVQTFPDLGGMQRALLFTSTA